MATASVIKRAREALGGIPRYGLAARLFKFSAAALFATTTGTALTQHAQAQAQKIAPVKIVALGDSLVAGYGLQAKDAFPAQLETALKQAGHNVRVINAGVSGDTTAGGLARADWALADKPDVVIISLGANDMLRGLNPAVTRDNLDKLLTRVKASGATVLLAGMYAAPTLGNEYGKAFNAIYADLARKHDVALYPFFLDGVAMQAALNLADGLHPNPQGIAVIVRGIMPYVERLLPAQARS